MKIYIAGRYSLLNELAKEGKKFSDAGFTLTSSWLNNAEDGMSFKDIAVVDLQDVDDADTLVVYTENYGTLVSGGGRHVETGYALGKGKKVIVVGPLENVFHWHPDVVSFPRTEYAIRYLQRETSHV